MSPLSRITLWIVLVRPPSTRSMLVIAPPTSAESSSRPTSISGNTRASVTAKPRRHGPIVRHHRAQGSPPADRSQPKTMPGWVGRPPAPPEPQASLDAVTAVVAECIRLRMIRIVFLQSEQASHPRLDALRHRLEPRALVPRERDHLLGRIGEPQ